MGERGDEGMGDGCQGAATGSVLLGPGPHPVDVGTPSSCPLFDHLGCLAQTTLSSRILSNIMGASGKVAKELWLQVGGTCVHLG